MGVEMEEISQTERYPSGVYREQILLAVRHRDDIEAVLARYRTKKAAPDDAIRAGGRRPGRLRRRRGGPPSGSAEPGAVPVQAVLPHVRARHHHRHVVRRRDDGPRLHLHLRAAPTPRTSPRRTRGSWSGRSTGRCAGPSSTSTSSRPAWTTRRPARRTPSARSWSRSLRLPRAGLVSATPSSASPVCRRCRRPRGACPPPRTPCGSWRRRSCAGSTCAATPSRPSTSTSAPRWSGSTTSGTPWPARPRTPTSATSQVLAWERASATAAAGPLPAPPVVVPFRLLSSVADVTAGSAEQIGRIVEHVGHAHSLGRRPPAAARKAMAWTREYVPGRDRTTVRDDPGRRAARRAGRGRGAWLRCSSTGSPSELRARRRSPRSSTASRSWPAGWPSTTRRPTQVKADQKEFFGLLYRLLVDAERGPRLPTLVMALGADTVRALLTPPQ